MTVYDKLVVRANAVGENIWNASILVTKARYDLDKQGLKKDIEEVDKKIPYTSGLTEKTSYRL